MVLRFVRDMRQAGHSVLFITHNIHHVFQVPTASSRHATRRGGFGIGGGRDESADVESLIMGVDVSPWRAKRRDTRRRWWNFTVRRCRRQLAERAGSLSQVAGVRLMTLSDGVERGVRILNSGRKRLAFHGAGRSGDGHRRLRLQRARDCLNSPTGFQ